MSKTTSTVMKVAVVGGGPSGLTLAGILGREAPDGFEVTILERGSKDRFLGAGWDVSDEAKDALCRAGVEPEVYQCPGSDNMMFFRVDEDKPMTALRLPPYLEKIGIKKDHLGLGECNLETERARMVGGLIENLPSSTKIHFDVCISEARQADDKMELLARDCSSLGMFDAVVDASGVNSTLRRTRFSKEADAYYTGKCHLMSILDDPEKSISPDISRKLGGTTGFYGPSPDGKSTEGVFLQRFGADSPKQTLSMMMTAEDPQTLVEELSFEGIWGLTNDEDALQRVKDFTKKRLAAFPPEYREMFDKISGAYFSKVKMHPSHEVMIKSTVPGSEALPFVSIGDALHALPPWSGMSGNYSLQDASDLASALIALQGKGWSVQSIADCFRDLEKSFVERTEERRKQVARTPEEVDYMSFTSYKDASLVGNITNKAWSWTDPLQVAIAGYLRFVTFLNRFDNYGAR